MEQIAEKTANPVLSVEQLCKRYETAAETREILRDISFTMNAGQSLAIMGPSGSGKTTLLNILGTLDTPSAGRVKILGRDAFALRERELAAFRNAHIGFIFELHHLLPQCSVLENVLLPAVVHKSVAAEPKRGGIGLPADSGPYERAVRLLERVGLQQRLHDRPARLSGGERQRAAVVRALINAPQLVLADEPTGSLDHASAETIGALLAELKREENLALIVVTHTLDLAKKMDAVVRLENGKLESLTA